MTPNDDSLTARRFPFAAGAMRLRNRAGALPPTSLVLLAVGSVQLGSGVAKHLFHELGPGGAAFLRLAFGAVVVLVLWRPRIRGHQRQDYAIAALFGLTVAAMNLSFYSALDRIPLGIAVTLEFVGPLGVAVAGSRRMLDVLWIVLAATGVLLLAPWTGIRLDARGVALALLAGCFWAAYIVLSARVGRAFTGGAGLAMAMVVGALALAPVGLSSAGPSLLHRRLLLIGACVGVLSSVIPYSLELEALRHLPTRVFGVLMSTEPAMAAIVGFLVVGEVIELRAVIAILLVSAAAAGASRFGQSAPLN